MIGANDPPPPPAPLIDQIEATEPSQLPPAEPTVQQIIDNASFYDDTV